jgi:hypothetical protein
MNRPDDIRPTDYDDVITQDQEDVVEGWSPPAEPSADADSDAGVPE